MEEKKRKFVILSKLLIQKVDTGTSGTDVSMDEEAGSARKNAFDELRRVRGRVETETEATGCDVMMETMASFLEQQGRCLYWELGTLRKMERKRER